MASEAAILLRDVHGEKNYGKITGLLKSGVKVVCRGELLLTLPRVKVIPRKDGKSAHNYQLASDPAITLFCTEEDVAPLSDYEYHLMVAVKSREARYEVFQKDILDWGSKLKAEMVVHVSLPSKAVVSSHHALAIIRYIGPLPNENGVQFGVEIMDGQFRQCGSSNGFFGGQQFFTCDENSALFVPLERLSPMEPMHQNQQVPIPPADVQKHHQMTTRAQSKAQQQRDLDQYAHHRGHSPKQPRSHFKFNDRVLVHDKHGTGVHGSVKWIEEVKYAGDTLLAIGIETDVSVQSKDFVGSLHGMTQHFKCSNDRHGKLVMPESMVFSEKEDAVYRDEKKVKKKNQESSVDAHVHAHECAHAESQFGDEEKVIQQVTERSEDEYLKDALNTSTIIDRDEQARILSQIEREKKQSHSRPGSNHYEVVPDPVAQPAHSQPPASHSHGNTSPSVRGRQQGYRPELQKMHDQHSVQDEHLLGYNRGRGGGIPLRTQRSMPGPGAADQHHGLVQRPNIGKQPYQAQLDPASDLYRNVQYQPGASSDPQQPFNDRRPSDSTYQNLPVGGQIQHGGGTEAGVQPGMDSSHVHREQMVQQQLYEQQQYEKQRYEQQQRYKQQQQRYEQQQKYEQQQYEHQQRQQHYGLPPTQPLYDPNQYQLPDNQQQQPPTDVQSASGMGAKAVAPEETISRSFSMGSTVQLSSDPPRYGVIQWMGTLPDIAGRIAGVELEEPMEGCGDGSWSGKQYFNCQNGHGFFCPVASLAPDQRFAQLTASDINPLDGVAMEEPRDQFINPGQIYEYIGEGKGIQGHQNSCYLDSTVFGLFAASDVFDNMFLEQKAHDPAGDEVKYLLWKGIVNPLRKNGVVRHESVMKLRNKLEELGKMKGVNQDEKDPEEFLNMLFKHTLHVPPFINIKRPFGVEQEYFVQLFVERDDSLKLPTVGDLLSRMFREQKIRFTKVPSKLLIQIPRYGREYKTYQKTIPSIKLELKGLLTSKHRCFICADSAWKECRECTSYFTKPVDVPPEMVYFCEKCSQLAHGQGTKRDKHVVVDVAPDTGRINELDLLSVICIETSHYICFTRSEERWVFFDSMANRVNDMYNIPKVVDCTDDLNEWVYPANDDLTRLLNTPPRELPEYVRRFTQDIYLCVYIQPDVGMYGDFDDNEDYNDSLSMINN